MIKKLSGFFKEKSDLSMMRFLSLSLVWSGIIIVGIAVWFKLDGAHYGLELACLGVLGKAYQKTKEKA